MRNSANSSSKTNPGWVWALGGCSMGLWDFGRALIQSHRNTGLWNRSYLILQTVLVAESDVKTRHLFQDITATMQNVMVGTPSLDPLGQYGWKWHVNVTVLRPPDVGNSVGSRTGWGRVPPIPRVPPTGHLPVPTYAGSWGGGGVCDMHLIIPNMMDVQQSDNENWIMDVEPGCQHCVFVWYGQHDLLRTAPSPPRRRTQVHAAQVVHTDDAAGSGLLRSRCVGGGRTSPLLKPSAVRPRPWWVLWIMFMHPFFVFQENQYHAKHLHYRSPSGPLSAWSHVPKSQRAQRPNRLRVHRIHGQMHLHQCLRLPSVRCILSSLSTRTPKNE